MEGVEAVSARLFDGAYEGRHVLVTGHTGFKGAWLCEWLLALGAEVTGYSLEPPTNPSLFEELGLDDRLNHVVGDVRDLAHVRRVMGSARPEFVFHLAAQSLVRPSYDEPVATFDSNVMGTVNVLEAVRSCSHVRVALIVTSDKCYENRETDHAYHEGDAMGGHDPYSASKGCAELVTAAYRSSFFGANSDTRIASARAGNVIGGGDWARDRIVPDCIRALQAEQAIVVRNPSAIRPWQHVLEPLSGYLHLASTLRRQGSEYDGGWNFGPVDEERVPVGRVVDSVIAAWGSGTWETPAGSGGQPHEAHKLALDITKATEQLGWAPTYDTESAIRVTAAWYAARHKGSDVAAVTRQDIDEYVRRSAAASAVWAAGAY